MIGAEALVATLLDAGVEVVFGLPGVHNLAAWEALRRSPIRLVGVRHEQTAVYAADGYARATGRLGVALVTTGPGAANTLGATGEAWASRSPVLVIATDIPTSLRRPGVVGGSLHEAADQRGLFAPVTKATFAWPAVQPAIDAALDSPRRPVYLEVPTDALSAGAPPALTPVSPSRVFSYAHPPLADHVGASVRPLVWAGSGALHAGDGVALLAERLGAPVFTTYSARGLLAGHPNLVGLPPHVPEAGALWDDADLVVAVGSDLDGMSTMNWRLPQPPRVLAINVDPADAARNYRADVIAQDASFAAVLAESVTPREPWADLAAIRAAALGRLRGEHPAELGFLDAFAAVVPDEALVVADMCIPGYWLAGFWQPAAPRRFQYPMGWGTLGYAFPAAVGAALAPPRAPVVSVSGDGGFLFACGELATVAQEGLDVTAVIVDDGGYGMLRYDQRRSGHEAHGVDLHTPDFVALARAFGLPAEGVDGLGNEFGEALARHIHEPGPSVLVARAALEPPPTTSPRWHRTGPPAWAVSAPSVA